MTSITNNNNNNDVVITMFIDGTDCPAALINHECGQFDDCPANVQLQKDADTGRIWVVSIKNIPGPVGGKVTWLALDYNFPETERLSTAESEAWWRAYICPNCRKGTPPLIATVMSHNVTMENGMCLPSTSRSQAAWLHTSRPGAIRCMVTHGYVEHVTAITADDSSLNVFRPYSKIPANKLGLGFKGNNNQPLQPPLILRAHMTITATPINKYEAAYAQLHIPDPETSFRADKELVLAHTTSNSNPAFRRRMLSIIQEGNMDDITLWSIDNKEQLLRHDLVQRKVRSNLATRAATTSQQPATAWQSSQTRRSAEERKLRTPHFFQSISDSGTYSKNQQGMLSSPVVPAPHTLLSLPPLASTQDTSNQPIAVCFPQTHQAGGLSKSQKRTLRYQHQQRFLCQYWGWQQNKLCCGAEEFTGNQCKFNKGHIPEHQQPPKKKISSIHCHIRKVARTTTNITPYLIIII